MKTIIRSTAYTFIILGGTLGIAGCASMNTAGTQNPKPPDGTQAITGCFGTYNAAPRSKDGRVDIPRLLGELGDLRANTYNWLIWHAATDWDDLQQFLPLAREKGIRVWVTLVPPSESPPHTSKYAEPFRLDYERWAVEIARLSAREPNLVAWSIDDFVHNLKVFTPDAVRRIRDLAHKENPRLAFVPCCYFSKVTSQVAADYHGLFDGVLFPYRHESAKANLTDASLVEPEVQRLRELLGPGVPIIVDVYATRHSSLGDSTPEYVKQVMEAGRRSADGVLVYCHQPKGTAKYEVIQQLFHKWSAKTRTPRGSH